MVNYSPTLQTKFWNILNITDFIEQVFEFGRFLKADMSRGSGAYSRQWSLGGGNK